MPSAPALSVVVPVFNGAATLPELVARLGAVMASAGVPRYEVILVDDGSADASWEVIGRLAASDPCVRGIGLMRNFGQHNALLAGIRAARFDVIATLDDDLQHPPEELPKLLAALGDDVDVVYGTPTHEQHGFLRDLASKITKVALASAMGSETARKVSAFRVFRAPVRKAFDAYVGPHVSVDVLLTWGTRRFAAVPVEHLPRATGESNYTFLSLFNHAMNMATGFSTRPLQLASLTGFVFSLFGGVVLVFVVGRRLVSGSPVPGFAFLASAIAIFSGAQLFALGIIGEYLARMHFRMMQKPAYAVRSEIGTQNASGTGVGGSEGGTGP